MTDISDLEQRLTGALDRMRAAWQTASTAARSAHERAEAATKDNAALAAQLADAHGRLAGVESTGAGNAELEAEVATARAEAAAMLDALEAEKETVAALSEQLASAQQAAQEAGTNSAAQQAVAEGQTLQNAMAISASNEDAVNQITDLEARIDQLTAVNSQLRKNNAALRNAHAAAVPDAGLINDGLQAEIDALQALRAADRTEIDSVLSALKPLLEEQPNA